MPTHRVLCALAVVLAGCAGRYGGTPVQKAKPASGGIAGAALPYQILDARTGRQIDTAQFWTQLGQARAVCIGEDHSNPHHHWAQLEIVKQLAAKKPATERLALGLEMVQRPFQGVLDDYGAKRIDAAALQARVGWEERWGYDFGFYGPTLDAAVAAGGQLLALNAARELTKKVSRKGIDSLTPEERAQLPELNLADAKHRAWFDALMDSMGGTAAHSKKPEPETPGAPVGRALGLDEQVEHVPDQFRRNSNPVVGDPEDDFAGQDIGRERDVPAAGRELCCVVEQVRHQLNEPLGIAVDDGLRR
jgi:hypothetical protein